MATIRLATPTAADRIHEVHTSSIRQLARDAYRPDRIASWAGHVRSQLSASQNAIAFYRRMGYREVGRTEHCLPDGGRLQCIDMQRGLPTDPRLADSQQESP